ncbi:hypothetical protein [Rhizobium mayense]|uniref:Uncharacterized protein n=1 Tax=Rhizobium mayense TaxID=1312184 RepID=A0ABT7JQ18_9HYPH|nr:hypothetical protein [Rhizobium mayense]MDL2398431.1 hypothetical protein [Rhizobium mayense]
MDPHPLCYTIFRINDGGEGQVFASLEAALERAVEVIELGYTDVVNIRQCESHPMSLVLFVDLVNNAAAWCAPVACCQDDHTSGRDDAMRGSTKWSRRVGQSEARLCRCDRHGQPPSNVDPDQGYHPPGAISDGGGGW